MKAANPVGTHCRSCLKGKVREILNVGPQPPSNIYLKSANAPVPSHPLRLGVCPDCGLVQLIDPMPENMARYQGANIKLIEPEKHLDNLAATLKEMAPNSGALVRGVSDTDASLIARLENLGLKACPEKDGHEKVDILIGRSILEHARNPIRFVEQCRSQLNPGGLLVFEVPECQRIFQNNWHFFLWEEHILYFTPQSLRRFMEQCGLHVLDIINYELAPENSLVVIARPGGILEATDTGENVAAQVAEATDFGASFEKCADEARTMIDNYRHGEVIFWGAGHLGAKYINFYGIADRLTTVIDDNPEKQGLFLPGSVLKIQDSSWLDSHPECMCLMAVSKDAQDKIIINHHSSNINWHSIYQDKTDA